MKETANGDGTAPPASLDAVTKATLRKAALRYSRPTDPGIRRLGAPDAFRFVDAHGRKVRTASALARIRKLAIPPAWTSVWICEDPDGHLQATGRDARGRLQYR
ncbi:MAG TPA: DNA topoisomerase IB, partial [Casimicrobiaceae bacterium]|nr:DNA topoisomerase IB [Casimicrobiaceae bacterium]